jgi:hypothetical protein
MQTAKRVLQSQDVSIDGARRAGLMAPLATASAGEGLAAETVTCAVTCDVRSASQAPSLTGAQ